MNVYQCHYRGMSGYCCRDHNARWMFVPELGQTSNQVHRQVSLHEIHFENGYAKAYEALVEKEKSLFKKIIHGFGRILFPVGKPATVAGGLFAHTS